MKHLAMALAFTGIAAFVACNNKGEASTSATNTPQEAAKPSLSNEDWVKRGEYLVKITGCNDCHSPKKPGPNGPELIPELMLSGHAKNTPEPKPDQALAAQGISMFAPDLTVAVGPWGTTYSANLTPDSTTGIGSWTEEQFKTALTQGKYKGQVAGRMLLPPMPWFNYAKMADEDVKAIFMYLKSIKPVSNVVPMPVPPGK